MKPKNSSFCATSILALSAPAAFSLGFRITDQNAEATARGDAFAATADNPSAIYYNPAGITQLDGTRALMGSYTVTVHERVDPATPGYGSFSNTNRNLQPVPNFFLTTKTKDSPFAFGLGIYSPYGLSLEYPDDTPFRTTAREGKIVYIAINPVIAWKICDTLSIAVGPSINYGSAELQQGVLAVGDTFKFKGDGLSYSYGAGVKWDPHRMHHFGITYHSAASIDFQGHSTLETAPFTIATPYGAVPVAGINRREAADAGFRIPENVVFGYSFTPTPDWNFEFNADWTDWHQLKSVTLHQDGSDEITLPFHWQSSWFWEFGVTKKFVGGWQLSAGYIYSENSVPSDTFNPIIPDSNRHVLSAGIGKKYDHFNWNIAYQWARGVTRTVSQGTTSDGTYHAQANAINLTLGYDFETSASAAPQRPAVKPTLLIVDDEEGPRQSLRIVFKNDYNVLLATNGLDAIELVKTNAVDVTVLDIMMLGISGVDTLKEIKRFDPSVEVIMLTAFETIETARQALRHGASDYLNKPFDISTMRAAVAHAAQKHRATLEFKRGNQELQTLQREIHDHRMAEEMARTQGEIYASVLHDINSPLTIISGFVELINRSMENAARVEGEQLETIKGDLSRLNGQIARCVEISRRYLSFLHTQASEKSYVAVNQVMTDLTELLSRHPSARGQQLTVSGLDCDITAAINGTDFLQILLNLTINALQSTAEPHGVDVSCTLHAEPIDIGSFPDGPGQRVINRENFLNEPPLLAITIEDTGPGIPPENLRRMFEERFTTKSPEQGTGLGLSIVKRLIREAAGAIIIQTKLGAGAKFTVCLRTAA